MSSPKPHVHKFTCGGDLNAWLEQQASSQGLSIASVIRLTLYRKMRDEASNIPPIGTSAA